MIVAGLSAVAAYRRGRRPPAGEFRLSKVHESSRRRAEVKVARTAPRSRCGMIRSHRRCRMFGARTASYRALCQRCQPDRHDPQSARVCFATRRLIHCGHQPAPGPPFVIVEILNRGLRVH